MFEAKWKTEDRSGAKHMALAYEANADKLEMNKSKENAMSRD